MPARPLRLSISLATALGSMAAAAALAVADPAQGDPAQADTALADPAAPRRHHALSLLGAPQYPQGFTHFDWADPKAPKGGAVRLAALGGFDSLNPFSIKGNAASGLAMTFDTLMVSNPDEPSAEYGLVAEWVSFPDDFASATFGLRESARFHDGKPITPEDVIFSLETLKKVHPYFNGYYRNVVKAERTGEREVTFTFDKPGNRELPHIMGQLYVLPKHYWEGKGANGEARDLANSTLEPPLGSGPYKIKSFEANRQIAYERIADYWAKDLPVWAGQNNFDEMKYVYFRDLVPAFEAFKSGDIDFWGESRASAWASQYNFDAVKNGRVKKELLAHKRVAPMQAFIFNLRRAKFQDARVRKAMAFAFNFEEANQKLFNGEYVRTASFFDNSELAAKGLPQGKELEILSEVKDAVPPEVFTAPFVHPVNKTPQDFRATMMEATKLLETAGWQVRTEEVEDPDCGFFCGLLGTIGLGSAKSERVLRNGAGETLEVEILIGEPTFERIVLPYVADLKRLGIKASLRIVDDAQYEKREKTHDYDMIIDTFGQSHSPGNEQRSYWGSSMADMEGGRNTIGIKDKAIDKLIDRVVFAADRDELVAATRALDRVLLWSYFVVPQWYYPFERVAIWDTFGRPAMLPSQDPTQMQSWWIDEAKAKALTAARKM
jgi:microcin C transport system substrate-binding protein